MGHSQLDQLVSMANQIADNNEHQGDENVVAAFVALHLKRFWARSMKQQIIDYSKTENNQLKPMAAKAIALLAKEYA
ncbi:formate dehydrogenase subunit delta [Marinomonas sp. 15G1-11]|uniref:Formate dehydrogenase subunit delta n=1 Tax=Marinomonas phaeophyticola TaxID=3004091 RepID=A0ABT4JYP2_9GAMM|nr:formate dehydrogenase subunit delta [Marinomonas sp. 15G1-11]MCZ2722654.1 formate dehydrogenase subunit delta [Marinomonas sp. 15G1-11]